jgi:ribulose-phosphate 3-epimerase
MVQQHGAKARGRDQPRHALLSALEDVLDFVDFVLVMSVNPGFGGQGVFHPEFSEQDSSTGDHSPATRPRFPYRDRRGVSTKNAADIVRAGCDWLVAGSFVFHSADPAATVKELQQTANEALLAKV